MNILIVDDNSDDVFFVREAFRKAGLAHRLCEANNGVEAVAYLKGEGVYADRDRHPFPDAVLLDLNMPRVDGFEVLGWLRQDARCGRLVVHVLSASSREIDVKRAYALHANSYLVKPGRMDQLVDLVSAFDRWHRCVLLPDKPDDLHVAGA